MYVNGEDTRITDLWTVCLGARTAHALEDAHYGPDECGLRVRCPAGEEIFSSEGADRVSR